MALRRGWLGSLKLAVGLALLAALFWRTDLAGVWERLAAVDLGWLALMVLLPHVAILLSTEKWRALLRVLGEPLEALARPVDGVRRIGRGPEPRLVHFGLVGSHRTLPLPGIGHATCASFAPHYAWRLAEPRPSSRFRTRIEHSSG